MNQITMVYPYYDNKEMLAYHLNVWRTYSDLMARHIHIVLVDDGSPYYPAATLIGACPIPLSIYRIEQDTPWHQHAARNLGAHVSRDSNWLFLSDMDITVGPGAAELMVTRRISETCVYTMARRIKYLTHYIYKPHRNTFLVTPRIYWDAGGYDEDYCGTYGGDAPFLAELHKRAPIVAMEDIVLDGFSREVMPDSSTTRWNRAEFRARYIELFKRKKRLGEGPARPLGFKWSRVR